MADDLRALTDRLAIRDLLTAYAWHLDRKEWDELRALFAEDARLDYSSSGGEAGRRDEVVDWLAATLPGFAWSEHVVTNEQIAIDGDEASSRCYLFNPMGLPDGRTTYLGGRYHDRFRRTPEGWRFTERVIEQVWTDGWD